MYTSLCGSIALYGESVVLEANVKSPITTHHCRPRKSFVRWELGADSTEKLGRNSLWSFVLSRSLVHSQFRWYSNKQLSPYNIRSKLRYRRLLCVCVNYLILYWSYLILYWNIYSLFLFFVPSHCVRLILQLIFVFSFFC